MFSFVLLLSLLQKTQTESHTLIKPKYRVAEHLTFINLTHPALEAVDGRSPGLNDASIIDCLQVRGLINELIHGKPDPKTRTFKKGYSFNGQLVSLEDLVQLEIDGTMTPHNRLYQDFRNCLQAMRNTFIDFTKPLLGEAEIARKTNMHLIEEWCKKSNRTDSLLLHWGKIDEKEALEKASAQEFYSFCIDLKNFLHDLMFNCPKARELFKQRRISIIALKEVFTQLTGKAGTIFETALNAALEQAINNEQETHTNNSSMEQKVDRRKKNIYRNQELSEDIFQALKICAPEIDEQIFITTFKEHYNNKCNKFDASFIPQH